MWELGCERLKDSFQDHEEAPSEFAAVDGDVAEVELEGLGGSLDVSAESLCEDCLAGSDVAGYEDFGAGCSGFVDD